MFAACRHGSKAGVTETYEGHQGPVTGISAHAVQGAIDFSHLFLTSSFDWTVKLWSMKENRPLYSFEDNGDYVYDVAWSPVHPALFATVDGTGRLDLWDLNQVTAYVAAAAVAVLLFVIASRFIVLSNWDVRWWYTVMAMYCGMTLYYTGASFVEEVYSSALLVNAWSCVMVDHVLNTSSYCSC